MSNYIEISNEDSSITVVAPIYFLVWYNTYIKTVGNTFVVVPIYFLVWYNGMDINIPVAAVVVPIYFLVWYNLQSHLMQF